MSPLLIALSMCLSVLAQPVDFYGVDVSQPYGTDAFACLKALNLRFAIIRCYESVGQVDPACAGSVASAHAGGVDSVHAYMFPCPTCGNARGQVTDLLNYWIANNVDVQRLWFDIEGTQYWMGQGDNQQFYRELIDACAGLGLVCGVYSSASQWNPIFGGGFSYGANLPLWYADYDGEPSFDDFSGFGGWGAPTIKQFTDQGSKCGVSYDISWSPNLPGDYMKIGPKGVTIHNASYPLKK